MIVFSLVWWNYLVVAATVFVSVLLVSKLIEWQDNRRKTGPGYLCLVHVGTLENGAQLYCGQLDGHDGPHGGEVLMSFPETILVVDDAEPEYEYPEAGVTGQGD